MKKPAGVSLHPGGRAGVAALRWLIGLLLATLTLPAVWAQAPLMDVGMLQQGLKLKAVKILDVREHDGDDTLYAYVAGHIPGAINLPYNDWRASDNASNLRNPGLLPDLAPISRRLARWDLRPDDAIVIVHEGGDPSDFASAARVYWTLKGMGYQRLSILDGGMLAWLDLGLPLSSGDDAHAPKPDKATTTPTVRFDGRWLADRAQVHTSLASANTRRIDARPESFFQGEAKHPLARLGGTLPQAISLPYESWFLPNGRMKPIPELQAIARAQHLIPGAASSAAAPAIITFCNAGHWAAVDWFVLSELLGLPDVKIYAGSMVDWSQSGHAMMNAPSRWQQLLSQWRNLLALLASAWRHPGEGAA